MKTQHTFKLDSKPRTLKQWLHKHDTLVLIALVVATIAILYLV